MICPVDASMGELVRACKGVGECVVFRVGGCDRGTHAGRRRRIFRHFSHQAVGVRVRVGECGRQVARGGGSRSSVGPWAVALGALGLHLHGVGGVLVQACEGGGRRVGDGIGMIIGDLPLFLVPKYVAFDGLAVVVGSCPGYIQSGLGSGGVPGHCGRAGLVGTWYVGQVDGDFYCSVRKGNILQFVVLCPCRR